jgi:DNA-binding transcriptional ArsR family regulator
LTATPSGLILKSVLNSSAADRVFDALGDPTRRARVARLDRGPMSVSELARPFGITLAAVVQHVQVLERSRLVRTEKVGRVRTCWVEPTGLDVAAAWLAERRALWERRLDRLGDVLAEHERPRPEGTRHRDEQG